jgi:hypothetical protein
MRQTTRENQFVSHSLLCDVLGMESLQLQYSSFLRTVTGICTCLRL